MTVVTPLVLTLVSDLILDIGPGLEVTVVKPLALTLESDLIFDIGPGLVTGKD